VPSVVESVVPTEDVVVSGTVLEEVIVVVVPGATVVVVSSASVVADNIKICLKIICKRI
jgi:hypothetical protein